MLPVAAVEDWAPTGVVEAAGEAVGDCATQTLAAEASKAAIKIDVLAERRLRTFPNGETIGFFMSLILQKRLGKVKL